MKNFFSLFLDDDTWLIKEVGWNKHLQNIRESQFSLGNGLLGSRGILEEIPYGSHPGTYITGVYDSITSQVEELVNFPNPFNFKLRMNGEKIGVVSMDMMDHKRILNMQKGLLVRKTLFKDSKKRRYDYQSVRFLSMANKNIGVIQISLTPLDGPIEKLTIETGIDTSVHNQGVLTEGSKKHFRLKEAGQSDGSGYFIAETFAKKYLVVFRSGFYYKIGNKEVVAEDNIFQLKNLKKKQSIVFTKIFYVSSCPAKSDINVIKKNSEKDFVKAFKHNFNYLFKNHIKAWEKLWKQADIKIEGDYEIQKNLRFNIYHMLICAMDNNGFSSIGARTLSGEGYRGHVFWDTEIFLLPFYIYNFPDIARSILLYRYKRMDKAKEIAEARGFKGAMFPWESACTGNEQTPDWHKDFDGKVIRIFTHEMEHHITADIALAFCWYYSAAKDEKFFKDHGYELMFETARFWASRVEFNKKKKLYEIKNVIGPDEIHVGVNNNAYTNAMARWNLVTANKLFFKIKRDSPAMYSKLSRKMGITFKEAREWKNIASGIKIKMRKDKIIEQFNGYFKKRKVILREFDENGMPIFPSNMKSKDIEGTQLVKQADVLMMLYVFLNYFPIEVIKQNFKYYLERTIQKSSLSPSIHSIMALECGYITRAYQFFKVSLNADIGNLHKNTAEGIHAASLGGTWQAMIKGFAGVKIRNDILSIDPRVPGIWRKIVFSLKWRGMVINFNVKNERIKLRIESARRKKLGMEIFGLKRQIFSNKDYVFRKGIKKARIEQYY